MELTISTKANCLTLLLPNTKVDADYLQAFSRAVQQLADADKADDKKDAIIITPAFQEFPVSFAADFCLSSAFLELSAQFAKDLYLLEHMKLPVICVFPKGASGLGLEIALSCRQRLTSATSYFAFPEVQQGLMPAHGGIQRLARIVGVEQALIWLTTGKGENSKQALASGVVDAIIDTTPERVLADIQNIIADVPAQQPWESPDWRWAVSPDSMDIKKIWTITPAMVRKKTAGIYPAADIICSCLYEGVRLDVANATANDQRWLRKLYSHSATKNVLNIMATKEDIERRAAGKCEALPQQVGVVGAGMMGAGIAIVSACAGYQVVVYDISEEKVEQLHKRLHKHLSYQSTYSQAQCEEIISRVKTVNSWESFADCQLVIEAVYEDRQLKEQVFKQLESVLPSTTIIASNTSTLPITSLAEYTQRPVQFVGLHFFSPVERMPLIEIISGKQTATATLDYCEAFTASLQKTPIVVNDGRSFYTSRVFMTYLIESMVLLHEGQDAHRIERAGKLAGMPVAPLALADEISLELIQSIFKQTLADGAPVSEPAQQVVDKMCEHKRLGRKSGAGFYDYQGKKKRLWSELSDLFPAKSALDVDVIAQRLIAIQVAEAKRCLEEKIVKNESDANIGSVLGWGFPAAYGGVLGQGGFVTST